MINSKLIILFIALKVYSQEIKEVNYATFQDFLNDQNSKISSIKVGQTPSDVEEIMGPSIIVKIPKVDKMKPLNQLFNQPYAINEFSVNLEKKILVYWYFSTPKDQNGIISKSECTPVIFENNSLVGVGWDFFNSYRRKTKLK